jgi:hypothetical protein
MPTWSRNVAAVVLVAVSVFAAMVSAIAEGGGSINSLAASGSWREHHPPTEFRGGPGIVNIDGSSYYGGHFGDCGVYDVIYDQSGRIVGQQLAC